MLHSLPFPPRLLLPQQLLMAHGRVHLIGLLLLSESAGIGLEVASIGRRLGGLVSRFRSALDTGNRRTSATNPIETKKHTAQCPSPFALRPEKRN